MTDSPSDRSDGDDPPVVYRLASDCTIDDLDTGRLYHATIDGIVDYGVFVELGPDLSGLIHESNYEDDYDVGDEVVVELTAVRENGDLSFMPVDVDADYEPVTLEHDYDVADVADLDARVGEIVHLDGEVVQIKQTGGPTLIHVRDGTGIIPCAAFERAGVRAYPDIAVDDLVHVVGVVDRRDGGLQVEVDTLDPLGDERAADVRARLDAALADRVTPHEVQPLVEWPALAKMLPDLERIAERLRRAVLEHRPIFIRYHSDTDGMCASVPVELALERFIRDTHENPEAAHYLVRRLPSKAPFYEMEDVTRDLNTALEDRSRHGQKLPLLCMLDNGSTTEDVPAYASLDHYDVPVIVVDHHHPDSDAVGPYIDDHVNPYLYGEDYRVTTGMLCVELARMIDPSLTDDLVHVPAVAGLADRSSANAMDDYLAIADEAGYDEADLTRIGDALDYVAYWLRYDDGRGLINDVIDVGTTDDTHRDLVDLLATRAARDIRNQLEDALPHVEEERLSNGVRLCRIDVERYAHRFTYPAPGTTTGAIHDRIVNQHGEPAITIGYGPDFAVLRSDGVRLDIPEMVSELNAELAGAGVSGGGHLVVGSIRFVKGMREPVIDALIEKMATAEIDESLGAAAPRAYGIDDQ